MLATTLNRLLAPQLRQMNGPQLDRYIKRACRQRRVLHGLLGLMTVPVGFGSLFTGLYCGSLIVEFYWAAGSNSAVPMTPFVLAIVLGIAVPMLAWAALVSLAVRGSVTRFLKRHECPCGYSLSGLHAVDGVVTCPECADRVVLADRGLTPEMLLASKPGATDPER